MKAMARLKQAPMPMADRNAKNVRATVMAVTVARVATVRNGVSARSAVSAASAKTVRRLMASSRWKALPLIPEDQMHCQPRWTVNHALAILQCLPPRLLHPLQPPHRRPHRHAPTAQKLR